MGVSQDGGPLFYKKGYNAFSYEILETETMRETEKTRSGKEVPFFMLPIQAPSGFMFCVAARVT